MQDDLALPHVAVFDRLLMRRQLSTTSHRHSAPRNRATAKLKQSAVAHAPVPSNRAHRVARVTHEVGHATQQAKLRNLCKTSNESISTYHGTCSPSPRLQLPWMLKLSHSKPESAIKTFRNISFFELFATSFPSHPSAEVMSALHFYAQSFFSRVRDDLSSRITTSLC